MSEIQSDNLYLEEKYISFFKTKYMLLFSCLHLKKTFFFFFTVAVGAYFGHANICYIITFKEIPTALGLYLTMCS